MKLILVLLMSVLSGCASFRSYEQPIVKPELVASNASKKLLVSIAWKAVPDRFLSPYAMMSSENKQNASFYEELKNTGCCELSSIGQEPDLIINGEVDVSYKSDGFLEALVRTPAQFTFAIIPAWDNFHYKVTLKANNNKGIIREYTAIDSGLLIQWLPMAPLFIFGQNPMEVNKALLGNLHRNLIYRMKKDGLLVK